MAVTYGTITSITTIRGGSYQPDGIECCLVEWTMSSADTYAQGDDSSVLAVASAIENTRRDGRVVTLVEACAAHGAPTTADLSVIQGPGTLAVSTADITFDLNVADYVTEHANALITATSGPMGAYVTFTTA